MCEKRNRDRKKKKEIKIHALVNSGFWLSTFFISDFLRLRTGIIVWDSRISSQPGEDRTATTRTPSSEDAQRDCRRVGTGHPPYVCVCEGESECLHGQSHNWWSEPQCGWSSHFTGTHKPGAFAKSSLAYRLLFNKLGGRLGSPFANHFAMLMKRVRNMFLHCCFSVSPQYVTARNFCLTCWSIFEVSSLQKWKNLFFFLFLRFLGWLSTQKEDLQRFGPEH